jgi:hypothetical protein
MKSDSTIKADKDQQRQNFMELLGVLAKSANILQSIQQSTGKVPNYEQLLNSYAELSDLGGLDNLFIDAPMPPQPDPNAMPPQGQPPMQGAPQGIPQSPLTPQMPMGPQYADPELAQAHNDLEALKQ